MTIFYYIKKPKIWWYHIREFLHWTFHWHDWEYDYKCDCPDYKELMKWKKFKNCHYCSVHCETTYKNW